MDAVIALPENRTCRSDYSKDMRARSLEILARTVMAATDPRHSKSRIDDMIHDTGQAARVANGNLRADQARTRNPEPVDRDKFDMAPQQEV